MSGIRESCWADGQGACGCAEVAGVVDRRSVKGKGLTSCISDDATGIIDGADTTVVDRAIALEGNTTAYIKRATATISGVDGAPCIVHYRIARYCGESRAWGK